MKLAPVQSLYALGCTQREIGCILGVGQKTVWRFMRKHSIKARPASKYNRRFGARNGQWKGDAASYSAVHKRVTRKFGRPRKCEECGSTCKLRSYDWANMNGRLGDPSDYRRLCRSCHRKHDIAAANERRQREGPLPGDYCPF